MKPIRQMKLIKRALNSEGDYVIFQRILEPDCTTYKVVIFNSRTGHSRTVFLAEVSFDFMFKSTELAVQAAGMAVFEGVCSFMEIDVQEEGEGGKTK